MDWLDTGVNGPLVVIRGIHFAATAITTGGLVFRTVVAKSVLGADEPVVKLFRTQALVVAWISLAVTVASGVIWLLSQASSMSGLPLSEAMTSSVLLTVVNRTQFGLVSEIRLVLALVLAGCLAFDRFPLADWLAAAAALGLTAAIAWTGHAGATLGQLGNLHLAADALHLLAAAAWTGGLVPLALLLAATRRHQGVASASLALSAALRFSTLGIVSVAILLVTGTVNAWILVGSFRALAVTEYGQLLTIKIVVFAVMLAFAAVNRFWLTPWLAVSPGNQRQLAVLRQLTRNSAIEIALGLVIFAIVGMLGTLHPAIHLL
jgi:putative copper resistance protein D